MKRGLVVLSVVGLMCAGVATASVQTGDTELDLAASYIERNGEEENENESVLDILARFGYFMTDNVQIGITGSLRLTEIGDENAEIYGVGPFLKYHFVPTNLVVPYVGAQALWSWQNNGTNDEGLIWGPLAGLRYELNANNDFFVEYQYQMFEGDWRGSFDDAHAVFAGIIHQFK